MALPVGITLRQITVLGVLGSAATLGLSKLWDWWRDHVKARRERVYNWHRDLQGLFSDVISVGQRLRVRERTGVDPSELKELIPVASDLDAEVTTPPSGVKRMVDAAVFNDVQKAAGLVYHFVHLSEPEQDEESVAGIMRHQYGLLQVLDLDTDVEMGRVLDAIGEVAKPEDVDVSQEEAEQILNRFEEEANRRMEEANEMTVDELMQLPWEEVDQVVSEEARRELVKFSVEQYYEKAVVEVPRKARSRLQDSQENLFE
jgi:hypothetical protein